LAGYLIDEWNELRRIGLKKQKIFNTNYRHIVSEVSILLPPHIKLHSQHEIDVDLLHIPFSVL
jgi:hypothetical protein